MKKYLQGSAFLGLVMMMMACVPIEEGISTTPDIPEENTKNFACKDVTEDPSAGPVAVWRLDDGYCYPVGIFSKPTKADECLFQHFHYPLLALGGYVRSEEEDSCGMATSQEFDATGIVHVKEEVIREWNQQWESLSKDKNIFGSLTSQ